MEIRLSQYNAPFRDCPNPNIHYISLDDQLLMRLGMFDAHVWLYYKLFWDSISWASPYPRSTRLIEMDVYDPLTETTHHHEVNPRDFSYSVSTSESELTAEDLKFLDELYYKHGIKTAGKRIGRYD
jgi:hypothetical protein